MSDDTTMTIDDDFGRRCPITVIVGKIPEYIPLRYAPAPTHHRSEIGSTAVSVRDWIAYWAR